MLPSHLPNFLFTNPSVFSSKSLYILSFAPFSSFMPAKLSIWSYIGLSVIFYQPVNIYIYWNRIGYSIFLSFLLSFFLSVTFCFVVVVVVVVVVSNIPFFYCLLIYFRNTFKIHFTYKSFNWLRITALINKWQTHAIWDKVKCITCCQFQEVNDLRTLLI